jgi:hypothetical protein
MSKIIVFYDKSVHLICDHQVTCNLHVGYGRGPACKVFLTSVSWMDQKL